MADTAIAPYAQAAAVVNKDGTVVRSQGVVEVTRTDTGRYSIKVSADVALDQAVPTATLRGGADWGSEIYATCDGTDPIKVVTGTNGQAADQPFQIVVP